jgi:adenylate cyclase
LRILIGDPDPSERVEALLQGYEERGSRVIVYATLVVCVVSLPFCVGVALLLDRMLGASLGVVVAVVALYQQFVLQQFRAGKRDPRWDWLNVTVEVSIPTMVMALDAHHVGPAYALTSAPTYLYTPIVLVSVLRLRRSLSLYAGVLAAAEFLFAFFWLRASIPADVVAAVPSLQPANAVQRAAYLAITGVLAFWVCRFVRAIVIDVAVSARHEMRTPSAPRPSGPSPDANTLPSGGIRVPGQSRELTVLFCDLRDFASLCQGRDPGEVMSFVDCYYAIVVACVERHGGIVNKFLGDGVVALFDAPKGRADHALAAARAALEVIERARALVLPGSGAPVGVGIGIHTGRALIGTVGPPQRMEYTAIGDTVDLASRIESLNKQFGTGVLMTRDARDAAGESVRARSVGEADVKGRRARVEVFELLGLHEAGSEGMRGVRSPPRRPAVPS